jgi:quinoprotein glucose dehydrogenase
MLFTATVAHAQEPVPSGGVPLPPGSGKEIVERICSQCHALGLALAKRYSAEEWPQIIARMVATGAPLDAAQVHTVNAYLSANFGSTGAMPASAIPASALAADSTPAAALYPRPQGENQWPAYGGGGANANWSTLTQIKPGNVARLKPAWTHRYGAGRSKNGDAGLDYRFEVTPLIIGGVMYFSTPSSPNNPALQSSVTALDPTTGKLLWKYASPVNIHGRGVAYWAGDDKTAPRLVFGTDGGMIVAVDMTTGQPAAGFGRNAQIDAYVGVVSEIVGESRRSTFTIPNPVTVWKNLIITGARPGEVGPPQPRGDIRAWDARTGRLVWTFHTVPQPGEANYETYVADEARDVSGANVWSTMALDAENGIVYAPTGDGNSAAKGQQLYANTLLALDAATGKLRWHRQITHHDIWDWDLPTPPVLFDFEPAGRKVPAVLLSGKQGLVFVFNRLTGEPLNGFEERPTPQPRPRSDEVWPTQPFPALLGSIARTQMTRDEIPDLLPGMKAACQKFWDDNQVVSVPLYGLRQSPDHGTISYPGPTGGPNWGGGAYNADLGYYFINMQNRASYRPKTAPNAGYGVMQRNAGAPNAPRPQRPRGAPPFSFQAPDGTYLSCGATPWGELVAVDVKNSKIAWRAVLGSTPSLGKAGETTGSANLGGSLATRSGLVFIGAANDRRFRAFDAKTGRKLWETELEASAHSTPITYLGSDGKQYVAVAAAGGTAVGGPEMSDTLVAFKLP